MEKGTIQNKVNRGKSRDSKTSVQLHKERLCLQKKQKQKKTFSMKGHQIQRRNCKKKKICFDFKVPSLHCFINAHLLSFRRMVFYPATLQHVHVLRALYCYKCGVKMQICNELVFIVTLGVPDHICCTGNTFWFSNCIIQKIP